MVWNPKRRDATSEAPAVEPESDVSAADVMSAESGIEAPPPDATSEAPAVDQGPRVALVGLRHPSINSAVVEGRVVNADASGLFRVPAMLADRLIRLHGFIPA